MQVLIIKCNIVYCSKFKMQKANVNDRCSPVQRNYTTALITRVHCHWIFSIYSVIGLEQRQMLAEPRQYELYAREGSTDPALIHTENDPLTTELKRANARQHAPRSCQSSQGFI